MGILGGNLEAINLIESSRESRELVEDSGNAKEEKVFFLTTTATGQEFRNVTNKNKYI